MRPKIASSAQTDTERDGGFRLVDKDPGELKALIIGLLGSIPGAFIVLDKEQRLVYLNQEAKNILMIKDESLTGKPFYDVCPRNFRRLFDPQTILGLLEGKENSFDRYVEFIRKWFRVSAHSSDSCIFIRLEDITPEKLMNRLLMMHQYSVERAGDMVFWFKPGGHIIYANTTSSSLLGFDKQELTSMIVADIDPSFTGDRWAKFVEDLRTKNSTVYESSLRSSNRSSIPVEVTCNYLDYHGEEYLIAFARDIRKRKQAEEALRESEKDLAVELDVARTLQVVSTKLIQTHDGEALYNLVLDTTIATMHADFASIQLLDPGRGELRLIGHRGFDENAAKFWEWVRPTSKSTCGMALHTGKRIIVPDVAASDLMAGSDDQETYLREGIHAVQTTPLVSRTGALLGMFSTHWREPHEPTECELRMLDVLARQVADLIDRNRAEDDVINAKRQAELYLDLMGHDINNMHQVALGYLELARDMPPGEKQAEFLEKPVEVLQRSAQLIQNVRKLQKLREGVFQTKDVDVREVLAQVQNELGSMPGKTITLNMNGHGHCTVRANELLHDVFANLVNNAIKHTGNETNINVEVDVVTDNGCRHCRVAVEDDGPGIPDDMKYTLFDRVLKGTSKAKGMGLGLYLVKTLVDSYGGRVWVEDRVPGDRTKGARFVVMLPAVGK